MLLRSALFYALWRGVRGPIARQAGAAGYEGGGFMGGKGGVIRGGALAGLVAALVTVAVPVSAAPAAARRRARPPGRFSMFRTPRRPEGG